jgi:hypothetical protein
MPPIIIASLRPSEGRTAVAAGIGASFAAERAVRLARIRSADGADASAEDDATALAAVPGCKSVGWAVTEQEALAQAKEAAASGELLIVEAPAGPVEALALRLDARVIFVSSAADDSALSDVAQAASSLGSGMAGVILTRQPQRRLQAARSLIDGRGLRCLAVVPEDRLLAGPNVRELAEALHASRLVEGEQQEEAVEYVMLGPISADPGQPYFLQHGSKAVVNRFDKMDLHLAALAADPECLILTGGHPPSEYLIDRVTNSDGRVTVLLSPEDTVRTIALVDDLYNRTRFAGERKVARAADLMRANLDRPAIESAL